MAFPLRLLAGLTGGLQGYQQGRALAHERQERERDRAMRQQELEYRHQEREANRARQEEASKRSTGMAMLRAGYPHQFVSQYIPLPETRALTSSGSVLMTPTEQERTRQEDEAYLANLADIRGIPSASTLRPNISEEVFRETYEGMGPEGRAQIHQEFARHLGATLPSSVAPYIFGIASEAKRKLKPETTTNWKSSKTPGIFWRETPTGEIETKTIKELKAEQPLPLPFTLPAVPPGHQRTTSYSVGPSGVRTTYSDRPKREQGPLPLAVEKAYNAYDKTRTGFLSDDPGSPPHWYSMRVLRDRLGLLGYDVVFDATGIAKIYPEGTPPPIADAFPVVPPGGPTPINPAPPGGPVPINPEGGVDAGKKLRKLLEKVGILQPYRPISIDPEQRERDRQEIMDMMGK